MLKSSCPFFDHLSPYVDKKPNYPPLINENYLTKAKLQKEGIFFLIHLFARHILLMKKLKLEKTMTT